MAKTIKYLLDEARGGNFIRAFMERREIVVQVWLGRAEATSEPDGDWSMPKALGLGVAVEQAVKQTTPIKRCRVCGCTANDCRQCVDKTGGPCSWVEADLCSACKPAARKKK